MLVLVIFFRGKTLCDLCCIFTFSLTDSAIGVVMKSLADDMILLEFKAHKLVKQNRVKHVGRRSLAVLVMPVHA